MSQTPLWPSGHLPLKGGDRTARQLSPIDSAAEFAKFVKLPISPLEGEMAGRPERGASQTTSAKKDAVT
jgi:assimilatory nitrate reductase catalytic subunit